MDKDLTKGKGMTVGETQIGTVHSRGIFNLGEMPMVLLDEAWHRYHPYTMTKNHRNMLSTIRKVAKSDCAQQIREVKQAITSTYLIPKEHFVILECERGLCAAILVAMTDDNAAIIEYEMEGRGFRIASPTDMICIADSQQRRWVEMHFAPAAPDDVTFELKLRYSTVYCVVPSELEASVEKHGIPAPVSIIRGDATMEEIQEFANHQPRHTHRQPLASEYTLFAIDLSKIDLTIRFHGSIHVPKPLHTTTPIPPTALTKIKGNDIHVVPVII